MGIIELLLIGLGLSADAMSVTISNMFAAPNLSASRKMAMPILFGLFQGLMPITGFFISGFAADFIQRYAGIISFIILGFIGGKMIWDALKGGGEDGAEVVGDSISYRTLLFQAVATSIDAFAVGVTFAASSVNIWVAAVIIACCTFLCCLLMLAIGKKVGSWLGDKATLVGGIVLVIIGIKALLF